MKRQNERNQAHENEKRNILIERQATLNKMATKRQLASSRQIESAETDVKLIFFLISCF